MSDCTELARADEYLTDVLDWDTWFDRGMIAHCVEGESNLSDIASLYDIDLDVLNYLNPEYRTSPFLENAVVLVPTAPQNRSWILFGQELKLLERDVTNWVDFGLIQQLTGSEGIRAYLPEDDTYVMGDGTTVPRQELFAAYVRRVVNQVVQEQGFDDEQVKRDFLYSYLADDSMRGYESLDAKIEDILLTQLAYVVENVGTFEGWEEPPTTEDIKAALRDSLGESYTAEDLMMLVNDITYTALPASYNDTVPFGVENQARELLDFSTNYLALVELLEIRRAVKNWDAEREAALLEELRAQIVAMPFTVLDMDVTAIRTHFWQFYTFMKQRQRWMVELTQWVKEEEAFWAALRAQTEFDMNISGMLMELALGILVEPIDFALTLRDAAGGNGLALAGLLPFVPSALARIQRVTRNAPNLSIIARIGRNFPDLIGIARRWVARGVGDAQAARRALSDFFQWSDTKAERQLLYLGGANDSVNRLPYIDFKPSRRMVAQDNDFSCGPACAFQILRDAGVTRDDEGELITERMIRELSGYNYDVGGTDLYLLADVLTQLHPGATWSGGIPEVTSAFDPDRVFASLVSRGQPWIAGQKAHAVIVDRVENGIVYIRDPQRHWSMTLGMIGHEGTMTVADFMDAWRQAQFSYAERIN